jgi:DNA-binding response OmpR family regulator
MHILLVEDDPDLAQFIRKGLLEERYAVEVARDGETALDMACEGSYDLLIVDVLLPGLNGLSLCRRLREGGDRTPLLLLTVKDAVEDKVRGLDAGADDYMTKPFAFVELLARVRTLFRRSTVGTETRLKVGDLEMDPSSRRVWRGGKEIALTNREYALLEYLLRNRNRVVTRTTIIEHVWGLAYDPMTNIVAVHIRSLRAKIDNGCAPPLIATVRGVGYMLKDARD